MRKLMPDLELLFDNRLKNNGLAAHAIKTKNARLLMVEAAKVCVGIREKTGKNDGFEVELFQKTSGGVRGAAWCMYFVQSCIAYAEKKTGLKSHVLSSGHCLTTWNHAKRSELVKLVKIHPLSGAIPIWQHGSTTSGHTEILLSSDNKNMQCVGGNTSGADETGKVTREGNGVYYTTRSMQGFPNLKTTQNMKLLGFIIPF